MRPPNLAYSPRLALRMVTLERAALSYGLFRTDSAACEEETTPSDFMYETSCQRCGSGNLDHTGMPRRTTPLVKIQNTAPGGAPWTSIARKLGAFFPPSADSPWHSAQCCSNKFFPAATASGFCSKGLRFARAFSGAFSISLYTEDFAGLADLSTSWPACPDQTASVAEIQSAARQAFIWHSQAPFIGPAQRGG